MRDDLRTGIPLLVFALAVVLPAAGEEPPAKNAGKAELCRVARCFLILRGGAPGSLRADGYRPLGFVAGPDHKAVSSGALLFLGRSSRIP